MTIHIYEAVCPNCGQTFNPDGPDDLMHLSWDTAVGTDCGIATEYLEIHLEGDIVEVHTNPEKLQEALVERISHPERRHPRIKFRPIPATPEEAEKVNQLRPLDIAIIDQESQVREIMELLRPLDF